MAAGSVETSATPGPPRARVVHRTRGRLRLRVPERRHDRAWFTETVHRLGALPGVREASADPGTAGILLQLDPSGEPDPLNAAVAAGLIAPLDRTGAGDGPSSPHASTAGRAGLSPVLEAVYRGARRLNRGLADASGGQADLPTLGFLLFTGLALRQALRGELLVPAVGFLWYAFEMLRFSDTQPWRGHRADAEAADRAGVPDAPQPPGT